MKVKLIASKYNEDLVKEFNFNSLSKCKEFIKSSDFNRFTVEYNNKVYFAFDYDYKLIFIGKKKKRE